MISSIFIRDYVLRKIKGNTRLSSDGTELKVSSIFLERDPKMHMFINLDTGLWQCFKTSKKGNFISLYAKLENIPYKLAYDKFILQAFLAEDSKVKPPEPVVKNEDTSSFKLVTSNTVAQDATTSLAWLCLYERGLWDFEGQERVFYAATDGMFKDRVIIPYDIKGHMTFFQGRALLHGMSPKYLHARSIPVSNVLYPFNYESMEPLFVCEGAFDAITLQNLGFNATTTLSCSVSKTQIEQLKHYQGPIIVAYDADSAGTRGVYRFDDLRRGQRMATIYVAKPKDSKDWNEMYLKMKADKISLTDMRLRIRATIEPIDWFDINQQLDASGG